MEIQKIASFILPLSGNDGADLSDVHALTEERLIDGFGGFTTEPVAGAWKDEETGRIYRDSSLRYSVAANWTDRLANRLTAIASDSGRRAGQAAVMVTDENGEVHFVHQNPPAPLVIPTREEAARRAA